MNRVNSIAHNISALCISVTLLLFSLTAFADEPNSSTDQKDSQTNASSLEKDPIINNATKLVTQGQDIFRFDSFGDEQFWGDTLHLHQTIEGASFGGIGPGLTPAQALELGLKVDVDKLSPALLQQLKSGKVNLNDVAVTLALIQQNAVLGVKGTFNQDGSLKTIGLTCALCHSTVNNSITQGVGQRLDGWANRDLNVGAIIAFAPNMQPFVDLLKIVIPNIDADAVRAVLNSWGPGKFDAQLLLDGKAFNPQQITNGVVTATNVPGATLIPNAFDLAGFNQHTWTGDWGSVPRLSHKKTR